MARAGILAMERQDADYEVFNVGTGRSLTILQIAQVLINHLAEGEVEPQIVGQYRRGDIRHCFADIGRIRQKLGFQPQVAFEEGVADLISWVREQEATDGFGVVDRELRGKELIV